MSVFQAFILGIVQGVTEFLPISSSGFLILIPELFGWKVQALAFDGVVHLATLAAVVTGVKFVVSPCGRWSFSRPFLCS
jgi:undecaprenyl-diphosphatase